MNQGHYKFIAMLAINIPVLAGCALIRDDIDCEATEAYHFAREVGPLNAPEGVSLPSQRADRRVPAVGEGAGKSIGKCLERPPTVLSNESQVALREAGLNANKSGDSQVVRAWPEMAEDRWTSIDALAGADLQKPLQPGLPAWRIHDLLQDWARAWSEQESDAYFAFYAGSFLAEDGMSWASWRNERLGRIIGAANVDVSVYGAEVQVVGPDNIAVRFTERYRADSGTAVTRKQMLLIREGDVWSIKRERPAP
ncbi:MAG: hypothetical protein HKN59_09850 [Gammaproteobacteria bacterium]|nr:hypothetical protein [Gammaproteobacteria bacterium]